MQEVQHAFQRFCILIRSDTRAARIDCKFEIPVLIFDMKSDGDTCSHAPAAPEAAAAAEDDAIILQL